MGWTLGSIAVVSVVYVASFWFLAWKFERRKPLPALGWALLGGFARWIADFFLGFLFIVLGDLRQPLVLALATLALARFGVWTILAHLLCEPERKPLFHFGVIMTLVSFGLDWMVFGPPELSALLKPYHWGRP